MTLETLLKQAAGRPLAVTRGHLTAGRRKFPELCPLALALREGLQLPETASVRVQHPRTFLILEEEEAKLRHDPLLRDWLQLLDRPQGPAKSPALAVQIEMRWTPKGEMRPQLLLLAPPAAPKPDPLPPRRRGRPPKKEALARRRPNPAAAAPAPTPPPATRPAAFPAEALK